MDIMTRAPAPGSAAPGNLYTDLQSRTLWLGVDQAVDPAGAVLISDIMALQAADTANLNTAKSYTDAQIQTRAPLNHTHTSTQITDFVSAVTAVASSIPTLQFSKNMIMMYSGSLAEIGVGALAGWALCDGTNGTPDLRDQFIIGAGNKANNSKNTPTTQLTTSANGAHKHTNTPTALTIAQMPAHAHSATLSGSGSGGTDAQGNHQHTVPWGGNSAGQGYPVLDDGHASDMATSVAGNHAHNVSVNVTVGGNTNNNGGGATHTHDMDNASDHQHTVPALTFRDMIPYYAMAFIMKL